MRKTNQIAIILIGLVVVTTLLSFLIFYQSKPKVQVYSCTAILMNLKGLNYSDLQYSTYLAISDFHGTFDIFPLTVELKGACPIHAKRVYYSYREFPTEDICIDENNCLWRFVK